MKLFTKVNNRLKELEKIAPPYKDPNTLESYKRLNKYTKDRISFINFCVDNKITFDQIGCMLDISKSRVSMIYRYGLKGKVTEGERNEIRKRDGNSCVICGTQQKLHIHHIHSSKNSLRENLVTVCSKHHIQIHMGKVELPAKYKYLIKKNAK